MNKICTKCRIDKCEDEFSFIDEKSNKKRSRCKSCVNKYNEIYKSKNITTIRDVWRKASRKYGLKNKDKRRNRTLALYGLSNDVYNKMFEEQGGKCKICFKSVTLVVDHCHATGKVRALLCNSCNIGLGCFSDNIHLLTIALNYIKLFK